MPKKASKTETAGARDRLVSVRLPEEILGRLDRLRETFHQAAPGARLSQSDMLRIVITAGLVGREHDWGLSSPAPVLKRGGRKR